MSLQGTLATLGITEVLEFLSSREATGQLDVSTEMGQATYLFFEGSVAQCEYSFIRESGSDSAEATYYVVSELDGTFFFDEDQEPVDIEDVEEVGVVLSRTAEIAEKWLQVEEAIETPNHLLVRNNQLDGSVTIQPEWWSTLEVIGDGKTSMQVASETGMGLLTSSLLVLDMTNAGLLKVEELDPMSLEMPDLADESGADLDVALPAMASEDEEPAIAAAPEVDAPAEPAPEQEPVMAEEIAPPPELAPAPMPVEAPVPVEAAAPAPMPVEAPVPVEAAAQAPAPADSFEPAFAPAEAVAVAAPAPAPAPAPVVDENDGWASDHSLSYDQAQTAAAPTPAPAPVAVAQAAVPATAIDQAGELAPMPTEPQPHAGQAMFEANPPEPQSGSAVADEVLNDLSAMGDQLEQTPDANWELDGTFVADGEEAAPAADSDPFGELGGLIQDDADDEDRGSVLKFLRRD